MEYLKREEIYEERESLDDFNIDKKSDLDYYIFEKLRTLDQIRIRPDIERVVLKIFNDVYYICTRALSDKRCYLKLSDYYSEVDFPEIVIAIVYVYLSNLTEKDINIKRFLRAIDAKVSKDYDWNRMKNVFEEVGTSTFINNGHKSIFTFFNEKDPSEFASPKNLIITSEESEKSEERPFSASSFFEKLANITTTIRMESSKYQLDVANDKIKSLENEISSLNKQISDLKQGQKGITTKQIAILARWLADQLGCSVNNKKDLAPILAQITGRGEASLRNSMVGLSNEKDKEVLVNILEPLIPNIKDDLAKL